MQITLAPWLPHGAAGRDLPCLEPELGAAPVPALRVVPESRDKTKGGLSTRTGAAESGSERVGRWLYE
jgi:hypothetical protein